MPCVRNALSASSWRWRSSALTARRSSNRACSASARSHCVEHLVVARRARSREQRVVRHGAARSSRRAGPESDAMTTDRLSVTGQPTSVERSLDDPRSTVTCRPVHAGTRPTSDRDARRRVQPTGAPLAESSAAARHLEELAAHAIDEGMKLHGASSFSGSAMDASSRRRIATTIQHTPGANRSNAADIAVVAIRPRRADQTECRALERVDTNVALAARDRRDRQRFR